MRKKLSSNAPSAAARRRLAKLARQSDSTIDFSDIPPLTDKFWRDAARNSAPSSGFCSMNPFYRPIKQQLTLRLDADVVAWLRRQGKGYQTAPTPSSAKPCSAPFAAKPASPFAAGIARATILR